MLGKILPPLLAILSFGALQAPAASLLVYYDGTASGNDLVDLSGNGRNAIYDANGSATTPVILTTTPANGSSGAYASLTPNGSNQSGRYSVTPAGGFSYNFNNQSWSAAMFYNRQSVATNDTLFHIGAGDGFGGENELYAWATANNTNLSFQHYPLPDVDLTAAGKMNLNAWHHLAVTFSASGLNDGMGTLSLYADGVLIGTDSTFTLGTNNTFFFGGQGSATPDRNFIGFLDEMALFDGALTSGEIAGLANGSQTPITLVPEPSRALLLGLGLFGLLMRRRRK